MNRLSFSPQAARQVDAIYAYIARDNPSAAQAVVDRIYDVAQYLTEFPGAGRVTVLAGILAYTVKPYPYLLFYRHIAKSSEVRIVRILHGARRRPAFHEPAREFRV